MGHDSELNFLQSLIPTLQPENVPRQLQSNILLGLAELRRSARCAYIKIIRLEQFGQPAFRIMDTA